MARPDSGDGLQEWLQGDAVAVGEEGAVLSRRE